MPVVQDTRELNRTAVLTHLLLRRPASRKQISAASGISAATVTRAVEQLIADGLVVEVSELVSEHRGRRPVLLDLDPNAVLVAGVDVGASNTRIVVVDAVGGVRVRHEVATSAALDAKALGAWVGDTVRSAAGALWQTVALVHVGLPGAVARDESSVSNAPNLPQVEDVGFLVALRAGMQRPVSVDNDANYALLGEQHFGAARHASSAVMITLGAGLGSAISIDGRILRGRMGLIGEFGQIPAGPLGTQLEHLVTGPGILRSAEQSGHPLTSPAAVFAPDAPHPLATIRAHFDNALLIVLTAAMVSCEPDVIVLGGGIIKSLEDDLPRYREAIRQNLGVAPELVHTALGDFAGATGAAVSALHSEYLRLGVDETAFGTVPAPSWRDDGLSEPPR